MAHEAGALAWVDAVHYAAHEPIDVRAIDADVLICSPYKFCGPHLGMAYGRTSVLEGWRPYKVRPAPNNPLGRRFETGTQPYELLAGFNATIDYLDSIGGFETIEPYERALGERLIAEIPDAVTIYGLPGMEGRVPTFLANVEGVPAADVASHLGLARDLASWRTTRGTRSISTSGSAIRIRRSGSGSFTTTRSRKSTASWPGWSPRGAE